MEASSLEAMAVAATDLLPNAETEEDFEKIRKIYSSVRKIQRSCPFGQNDQAIVDVLIESALKLDVDKIVYDALLMMMLQKDLTDQREKNFQQLLEKTFSADFDMNFRVVCERLGDVFGLCELPVIKTLVNFLFTHWSSLPNILPVVMLIHRLLHQMTVEIDSTLLDLLLSMFEKFLSSSDDLVVSEGLHSLSSLNHRAEWNDVLFVRFLRLCCFGCTYRFRLFATSLLAHAIYRVMRKQAVDKSRLLEFPFDLTWKLIPSDHRSAQDINHIIAILIASGTNHKRLAHYVNMPIVNLQTRVLFLQTQEPDLLHEAHRIGLIETTFEKLATEPFNLLTELPTVLSTLQNQLGCMKTYGIFNCTFFNLNSILARADRREAQSISNSLYKFTD